MNIFRNALLNEVANNAIYAFFEVVRSALAIARMLNGLCFLAASAGLLGVAIGLVRLYGDEIPACDVLAFLVAWWAFAMMVSGLERIGRCRPKALPDHPPVALETSASQPVIAIPFVRRQATNM
ncbi:hypothetical protein [Bradyrhizobium sp. WSM1417]|uniref:hypothetical protein n=1 Tax=Bradyrhizobium sp. WSM1417 TaxID=754500 RepID=UPI0012EC9234|nr:hypothetical protein [Bradyrhizobium sp. WSM1417]